MQELVVSHPVPTFTSTIITSQVHIIHIITRGITPANANYFLPQSLCGPRHLATISVLLQSWLMPAWVHSAWD